MKPEREPCAIPADAHDLRAQAVRDMMDTLDRGSPVVIGTNLPMNEGDTVGRDGERHLVIKRPSTREEFLAVAPGGPADLSELFGVVVPLFFYEVEVWDLVIEAGDGFEIGIRFIRKADDES